MGIIGTVMLDFDKARASTTFTYLDADMQDSDCSEDYDTDPYFQETGQAYFERLGKYQQERILADKLANGEIVEEKKEDDQAGKDQD